MPGITELNQYFLKLKSLDDKKYNERILDAQKIVVAISNGVSKEQLGDMIFSMKRKYEGSGLKKSEFNEILDMIQGSDIDKLKSELAAAKNQTRTGIADNMLFNNSLTLADVYKQQEEKLLKDFEEYRGRDESKKVKTKVRTMFHNPELSNLKGAIATNVSAALADNKKNDQEKSSAIDDAIKESVKVRGPQKPGELDALLAKAKALYEEKMQVQQQQSRQDQPSPRRQ